MPPRDTAISPLQPAVPLPRVGVVIPLYNAEAWVARTIESVLAQTYPYHLLEVVIVDDGSTDGGPSIVASTLAEAPVRWRLVTIENGGPSRARNVGWRETSADWVQFLDADDLLHPCKIATQVAVAIREPAAPAVVYSDWQKISSDGTAYERFAPSLSSDVLTDLLKTENHMALGSQLFARSWLQRVGGFDERWRMVEDVDLYLRLAAAGARFLRAPAPAPLFSYRIHQHGSLSRLGVRALVDGIARNARLVEAHTRAQGELSAARRQVLLAVYFQACRYYAAVDPVAFGLTFERIRGLEPDFLPPHPRHLRWAARAVGYERAERLTVAYRRYRRLAERLLRGRWLGATEPGG